LTQYFINFISNLYIRWAMALGWTILLIILLVQPAEQPLVNTGIPPAPPSIERELAFTIGHIFTFTLLAGTWYWALIQHTSYTRAMWILAFVILLLGGVTEWAQGFVANRNSGWGDFFANCIGLLLVILFVRWLQLSPHLPRAKH
jgi:VanZ family protein